MESLLDTQEFIDVLKSIAPGTKFRSGLENILKAQTGALIVLGESEEVLEAVDGGFNIDVEMTPARLYELAKMDGAIVLSNNAQKILFANTQMVPDPAISSVETGTRHRTAERISKQTGQLVVAISQRRNIITLYKGEKRYILEDIRVILAKANQAIQTLEKYRTVLDQALTNLSALEFENLVTISDVATVLQRIEMVLRIGREIERYIIELGSEGRLIKMQLEELVANVKKEGLLIMRDYSKEEIEEEDLSEIFSQQAVSASDELISLSTISKYLGYGGSMSVLDSSVAARGYRLLRKIPRLPMPAIDNLVISFGDLQEVLNASKEELNDVERIGEVRAQAIKEGLKRLRDQVLLDRHV